MHYLSNPGSVRVDFFKPSGKWYSTIAVIWIGNYSNQDIQDAFAQSIRDHFVRIGHPESHSDFDAVCLEPYHEHSHPIMLKAGS